MISLKKEIDAITKRLRTPDNPWGSGPDYWDKLTDECGKLWGITEQNRSKHINESGVFIHTTKEAVCFGTCEIEIRIAAAPNGKYACAVRFLIVAGEVIQVFIMTKPTTTRIQPRLVQSKPLWPG
jgi:hypothetical protein